MSSIKRDEIDVMAKFLKMLGDESRLNILFTLFGGCLNVSDISKKIGMSVSAVSHQLNSLKMVNIVKGERNGKEIFYSLADDHVETVLKLVLEHIREKKNGKEL